MCENTCVFQGLKILLAFTPITASSFEFKVATLILHIFYDFFVRALHFPHQT